MVRSSPTIKRAVVLFYFSAVFFAPTEDRAHQAFAGTDEVRGSIPFREAVKRYHGDRIGKPNKIIGGKNAKWEDNQWQVALLVSSITDPADGQFCGGVSIKPDWVVTAGHCVYDPDWQEVMEPKDVSVFSGTDDLQGTGKRSNLDIILVHKQYDPFTQDFDIALLQLHMTLQQVSQFGLLLQARKVLS